MENFTKIMRVGTIKTYGGRSASIYIEAEYNNGKLSITGVVGPLHSGNALGWCGQIDMDFKHRKQEDDNARNTLIAPHEIKFAKGWNIHKWFDLLDIWKEYHLNDMQAGCEHQRLANWDKVKLDDTKPLTQDNMATWKHPEEHIKGLLTKACEICGYKYGTKWLRLEVPDDVLNMLKSFPNTDKTPAWV